MIVSPNEAIPFMAHIWPLDQFWAKTDVSKGKGGIIHINVERMSNVSDFSWVLCIHS